MICASCRLNINKSAKFCGHCGIEVMKAKLCGACDKENSFSALFCRFCGASFEPKSQDVSPRFNSGNSLSHSNNSSYIFNKDKFQQHRSYPKYNASDTPKPPYLFAIFLIIFGIVTATIIPSVFGVLSLLKCIEASSAIKQGNYREAKELSHMAKWNPTGLSSKTRWIIVFCCFAFAILIFIAIS
ncbi:MAG: zinc ribbon domain-containing protein [Candidatus Cloacimonadaceae bacterium]